MTTAQQLVIGIFRDHAQAEQAINELLQAGFAHHQIRFAGRGISTGGILEKIKSLFTGQDISAGGIYDDLVKMGAPPEDARYYQSEFEAGRFIVAIQGAGNMQEAINILVRHGGYGANQRFAQSAGSGTTTGSAQRPTTGGTQRPTTEDEQSIKLREEELRVRKQSVEAGETRIHKEVVIEPKTIDVPVTHEEVYIERHPGSGLPSDQPIGEGETIHIPVREEQVTTEKVPIEREEVSFGKRPVQETQRVTETVQREEAYIEHTDDVNAQSQDLEQGKGFERKGKGFERKGKGFERSRNIEDQTP